MPKGGALKERRGELDRLREEFKDYGFVSQQRALEHCQN